MDLSIFLCKWIVPQAFRDSVLSQELYSRVCAMLVLPAMIPLPPTPCWWRHSPLDDEHPSSLCAHNLKMDSCRPNLKSLVGFTSNITSVSFPMLPVRANLPVQPVSWSWVSLDSPDLSLRLCALVSKDVNTFHLLPPARAVHWDTFTI